MPARRLAAVAAILLCGALAAGGGQEPQAASGAAPGGLLKLLGIEPSAESVDYVQTKTQFQLHTLLTEQRHPKTWYLGERIRKDTQAGLRMLSSVDDDILARMDALAAAPGALEQAARAVETAILGGRKIYVYGCGATGRLAKQMESSFWRPFWRQVKADARAWKKAAVRDPAGAGIEDALVGEMTGADRALISSLEGFEDLQLIGRLQLRDRGVGKGDVVICVTEGGETSSVIGTVLAALDQWKAGPGYDPAESRKKLYFVYNNPDERLMPFDRSRSVLDEPGITKINLTTGPQAITGSTRMQATTIETYVVGAIVETAIERVLASALGPREHGAARLRRRRRAERRDGRGGQTGRVRRRSGRSPGRPGGPGRPDRHRGGRLRRRAVLDLLRRERPDHGLHRQHRAQSDFPALPLDTIKEPRRKCWIQVWTKARDAGRSLARLPGPALPGPGRRPVPGAVRDGSRRSLFAAGGPREPEEGRRRAGGPVRFLALEGEHGRTRAEEG